MRFLVSRLYSGMIKEKLGSKDGLSLIETLIALGIMVMVLMVIISSFLTVLVSSAKARILKEVEEDGKYAQRLIEQRIRSASAVIENSVGQTCEAGMSYLNLQYPDGSKTEIGCMMTDETIVYLNDGLISSMPSEAISLISPKTLVTECSFDCIPGGFEEPDRVGVTFTVQQAEASTRVEEQMEMSFRSVVVLRNF